MTNRQLLTQLLKLLVGVYGGLTTVSYRPLLLDLGCCVDVLADSCAAF